MHVPADDPASLGIEINNARADLAARCDAFDAKRITNGLVESARRLLVLINIAEQVGAGVLAGLGEDLLPVALEPRQDVDALPCAFDDGTRLHVVRLSPSPDASRPSMPTQLAVDLVRNDGLPADPPTILASAHFLRLDVARAQALARLADWLDDEGPQRAPEEREPLTDNTGCDV